MGIRKGQYVILIHSKGFFVEWGDAYNEPVFSENKHSAHRYFTNDGAIDIAHNLWLAGHGDYSIKTPF